MEFDHFPVEEVEISVACHPPPTALGRTLLKRVLSGPGCPDDAPVSPSLAAVTSAGQQLLQQDSRGPPRAQCRSSCRSTAFSRVSPSPKRCQAKAGSGWGKGPWPGSLCSLLNCLWELWWGKSVGAKQMGGQPQQRPPPQSGPLASATISLQTQHPRLNNGFCPGNLGAGRLGLLGGEIWSSFGGAPNTGLSAGAGNSEK